MSRRNVDAEQRQLKEATQRYFESLPPMHRELLHMVAADLNKPPYAIIAGAIEDVIVKWRTDFLSQGASSKSERVRLA